jgi:putative two-component system response regulator
VNTSERSYVLVVEYSEQLRIAYADHLAARGFEVIAVDSGSAALDHLRTQEVAVMVLNIGLPGMSGGTTIREALEISPDLAVIAVSVVNDAGIAAHCMRSGAIDFLLRPVGLPQLESAVTRALKRRQVMREERVVSARLRDEMDRRIALSDAEVRRREQATVATLDALVEALEAKTPYLNGHSARVARLGSEVAAKLASSDEEIGDISLAGRLHDVGMIGIREDVTNKTGPLDDEEAEHVRRHVLIGARVLSPLSYLGPVVEFVRSHHERWDGTGYPDGLSGAAIPIGARILAAAEIYDALTSERPYRRKFSAADAADHVQGLGGIVLDPAVASALAAIAKERRSSGFVKPGNGDRGIGAL